MDLPLELPISPMLAKAVADLPAADSVDGGWSYEPKWDGFRCLVCRDGDEVELLSRSRKPLTRYFPEVVALVRESLPTRCILDGELVVRIGEPGAQKLDWESISARIHPAASRIQRLSAETPAELVCFDLLALGDEDLTALGYRERRARLEQVFASVDSPAVHLTRVTGDESLARQWFEQFEGAGLDGVICKRNDGPYEQNKRSMLKVKHKRTAEAVVLGYRVHKSGQGVGSLLLGMVDDDGELVGVGGIGAFSNDLRLALVDQLEPLVLRDDDDAVQAASKERSRFTSAAEASFVPLDPQLVVEVAFDQLEGRRFRHAVTLLRFRPDREPSSCLLEQVGARLPTT
ncbi:MULTISPECIES: ATP-dependent DNA ligase [unclassified Luteococcus]|uniref:ATP-dependent DNA ligase n=1 Tax=unclassified Luteococcus TaxID=2639923 RepID=UPI00313D183B